MILLPCPGDVSGQSQAANPFLTVVVAVLGAGAGHWSLADIPVTLLAVDL